MSQALLKNVSLFSHLGDDDLRHLADIGRVRSVAADQVVFAAGDEADGLYVILEGKVRAHGTDDKGNQIEYARMSPGDYFGEMALLDSKPRSASISSLAPSSFFILGKDSFLSLVSKSPAVVMSILSNLTGRLRAATDRYYKEALAKQQAELEKHRALSQMVAGVAHEINTPLGIVSTAVSLITENLASPAVEALARDSEAQAALADVGDAVRLIQDNLARANKLIVSFKNLSVRQVSDQRETVDLPTLVEELVGLFRIEARKANLKVRITDQLADSPREWDGYPGYLSQVIMNLLTNVERYAYPARQGGEVEVVLGREPAGAPPGFTILVRDFGKGIAPEHLPLIFEPFFTTGRGQGGSGLGLAIVRNLVTEALNGSISATSEVGKGTTFTIALPRSVPHKPA